MSYAIISDQREIQSRHKMKQSQRAEETIETIFKFAKSGWVLNAALLNRMGTQGLS
jgi:shikimate kinase